MSKLEMVKIKARTDAYGQSEFDVVTVDGEHVARASIGTYKLAQEIAERIDDRMIYERDNGAGSLDTF